MKNATQISRSRGFSLLELIIVLSLAGLLSVTAVLIVGGAGEEEKLRTELGKIEDLVQLARANSVNYQIPFVITLEEGKASMGPLNQPLLEGEAEDAEGGGSQPSVLSQNWPLVEEIDSDYQMQVYRWGGDGKGVLVENSVKQVWIFEPEGLCEPVSVRLFKDDGDISLTRAFHPLTAMAEDEEKTITTD